jgi:hypothetical protein
VQERSASGSGDLFPTASDRAVGDEKGRCTIKRICEALERSGIGVSVGQRSSLMTWFEQSEIYS